MSLWRNKFVQLFKKLRDKCFNLCGSFHSCSPFTGLSLVLLSFDGYCGSVRSYNQHFAVIIVTLSRHETQNSFGSVSSSTRLFLSFWRLRRVTWLCSRPFPRASGFTRLTARWQHHQGQDIITFSESDHHSLLPDVTAPGASGVSRLSQLRHLHHHQVTSADCVTMEHSKQNTENKGVLLTHSIHRTRSKRLNSLSKRQKRDLVVGTVLIIIVCVFMVCHSLKFVINMVELCTVVSGRDTFEVR